MEPWKINKRFERNEKEGVPVTVWHEKCMKNVDIKSQTFVELQSHDFNSLRIYGPLTIEDPTMPGFFTEECRACTRRFVFRTQNNLTATILTGKPGDSVLYNAISYVWGDTRPVTIYCRCGSKKTIPISSSNRFCNLLSLARTAVHSEGIWLDALSIDQDSDEDKKVLIGAMGDIYKNAQRVLVLLPAADDVTHSHLLNLRNSVLLQDKMGLMDFDKITQDTFNDSHGAELNSFIAKLEEFKQNLGRSVYFQRAWTFQEWALAQDVDVTCEGPRHNNNALKVIPQIKSCIIRATVRLAMHRRNMREYGGVRIKLKDADLAAFVDDMKSIFPQEDLFCSSEEVDWEERMIDTNFPTTGMNHMLGLRLLKDKLSPEQHLRARLHMMLNAFNLTQRKARFQADMVACWASMCNLSYEYNKDDDILTALRKAIHAIRAKGVKVYNFQASVKGSSADSDLLSFHTYSTEQPMRTSTNRVFTLGAPSFTGFADSAQHLVTSLIEFPANTRPGDRSVKFGGLRVPLRKVKRAKIDTITPAENKEIVSRELARIQTGETDPLHSTLQLFWNVKDVAFANLQSTEHSILQKFCLVVVSFLHANTTLKKEVLDNELDTRTSATSASSIKFPQDVETLKHAWAVCPNAFVDHHPFIAREGINGTLVLARTVNGVTSVLAYLTGIDQMSGSYLLPTSEDGSIKLALRAPQRTDVQLAARGGIHVNRDRLFDARVELEEVELIGF